MWVPASPDASHPHTGEDLRLGRRAAYTSISPLPQPSLTATIPWAEQAEPDRQSRFRKPDSNPNFLRTLWVGVLVISSE